MKTHTQESQASMTPAKALQFLKEGNNRFLNNLKINRNLLQQMAETSSGQFPFAVILSCIDSRSPAELIFDQGLGDIFSIRIAGNILNEDILGSMEFACKVSGSKLIMVLGHTNCGAIRGACDNVEMGNLTALLGKIKPSVDAEKTILINRDSSNSKFVERVTGINVKNTIKQIFEKSPLLKEMTEKKQIDIAGGMYNVETGKVNFFDESSYSENEKDYGRNGYLFDLISM